MPKRPALTHVDVTGKVRMVDVGAKPVTERSATAEGFVRVSPAARRLVAKGATRKGSPLEIARIAGIQAAKRTSDLIPLCHPLALTSVAVDVVPATGGYRITATVRVAGKTGVEMEALTAVSVAALTIYDMLKAADRSMTIEGVRLLEKRGGRSGAYRVPGSDPVT
jgi:cyclic pyranopterin monophosphate synthase